MKKVTKTTEAYPDYVFHLIDDRTLVVDNLVVHTSNVYDIITKRSININIRLENGKWTKRSLAKIVLNLFGIAVNEQAVRILDDNASIGPTFRSIEEAAMNIIKTQGPTFSGKPVGIKAVSKNITNCLKQPDVYPKAYGYRWQFVNEREEAY